jgi:hypothetical protein
MNRSARRGGVRPTEHGEWIEAMGSTKDEGRLLWRRDRSEAFRAAQRKKKRYRLVIDRWQYIFWT